MPDSGGAHPGVLPPRAARRLRRYRPVVGPGPQNGVSSPVRGLLCSCIDGCGRCPWQLQRHTGCKMQMARSQLFTAHGGPQTTLLCLYKYYYNIVVSWPQVLRSMQGQGGGGLQCVGVVRRPQRPVLDARCLVRTIAPGVVSWPRTRCIRCAAELWMCVTSSRSHRGLAMVVFPPLLPMCAGRRSAEQSGRQTVVCFPDYTGTTAREPAG